MYGVSVVCTLSGLLRERKSWIQRREDKLLAVAEGEPRLWVRGLYSGCIRKVCEIPDY